MKELLEFLTKKIVTNPTDIMIEEQIPGEGFMNLAIKVNQSDTGILIGKQGRTIKSLKNLLKVKAIQEGLNINIELVNE